MLPDRVSNPGPLTYESGALPIALLGPATELLLMSVYPFALNITATTGLSDATALYSVVKRVPRLIYIYYLQNEYKKSYFFEDPELCKCQKSNYKELGIGPSINRHFLIRYLTGARTKCLFSKYLRHTVSPLYKIRSSQLDARGVGFCGIWQLKLEVGVGSLLFDYLIAIMLILGFVVIVCWGGTSAGMAGWGWGHALPVETCSFAVLAN